MLGGLFGGVVGKAMTKNLVEAMGAGGVFIAMADGSIDKTETEAIVTAMLQVPKVREAYSNDIRALRDPVRNFIDLANDSPLMARQQFRKEVEDVRGNKDNALLVAAACFDVARRSGGIGPEEKEAFKTVLGWLDLTLDDVGLPASF